MKVVTGERVGCVVVLSRASRQRVIVAGLLRRDDRNKKVAARFSVRDTGTIFDDESMAAAALRAYMKQSRDKHRTGVVVPVGWVMENAA